MTTVRLITDLVRRRWKLAVGWLLIYAYNTAGAFRLPWWRPDTLALAALVTLWSMLVSRMLFELRELYLLPVSRRDWWRALWTLQVVVIAPVIGFVCGLRSADSYSPEWSTRPLVFALSLGILAAVTIQSRPLRKRIAEAFSLNSFWLGLPGGLALFAAPFVIAPKLPHVFADFNIWWLSAYVALAAYGAQSYFEDPPIVARPAPRPATRAAASLSGLRSADGPVSDRLTGLRLDLYLRFRRRLTGLGVVGAGAVVLWVVFAFLRPVPSLPQSLINLGVLPFVEPRLDLAYFAMSLILTVVLLADSGGFRVNLVAMRAAPVPAWRLAAMPIATGIATAAMVYVAQLAAHLVTGHLHVPLWRLDLVIVTAAIVAVVDVVGTFTGRNAAALPLVLFAIPLFRTDLDLVLPASAYLSAGITVLLAAWFSSWFLVSRTTYAYRLARTRRASMGAIG